MKQPEALAQADREARIKAVAEAAVEMEDDADGAGGAGAVKDWDAVYQHTTGEDVAQEDAPAPAPDRADDEVNASDDEYDSMPTAADAVQEEEAEPAAAATSAPAKAKGKKKAGPVRPQSAASASSAAAPAPAPAAAAEPAKKKGKGKAAPEADTAKPKKGIALPCAFGV
jgi:hypothetical protein